MERQKLSTKNGIAGESMAEKGVRRIKRRLELVRTLKCLNTDVGAFKGTILSGLAPVFRKGTQASSHQ